MRGNRNNEQFSQARALLERTREKITFIARVSKAFPDIEIKDSFVLECFKYRVYLRTGISLAELDSLLSLAGEDGACAFLTGSAGGNIVTDVGLGEETAVVRFKAAFPDARVTEVRREWEMRAALSEWKNAHKYCVVFPKNPPTPERLARNLAEPFEIELYSSRWDAHPNEGMVRAVFTDSDDNVVWLKFALDGKQSDIPCP